jgi:putative transposase
VRNLHAKFDNASTAGVGGWGQSSHGNISFDLSEGHGTIDGMARPLRFVYPGAVYHIMARGNGGEAIFLTKEDHLMFLYWLGRVCESHGWRVHAWVLMGNHFHLLLETPEPNLVSGMKLLLGAFSQGWNRRHQRRGHVFQGRYKSIPVAGERASDPFQFRIVADYIHLNPARAGLAGGRRGKLAAYPWSSLPAYLHERGPKWLVCERVLAAFELAQDDRGRRAYATYLEQRARQDGGGLSEPAMAALRRGWYLGDDTFRDRLLKLVKKGSKGLRNQGSHSGSALTAHGEAEATRLVTDGMRVLGLTNDGHWPGNARKGDPHKTALATLIKTRTCVSNEWLARCLNMGHNRSVSRLIRQGKDQREVLKLYSQLAKMLPCED